MRIISPEHSISILARRVASAGLLALTLISGAWAQQDANERMLQSDFPILSKRMAQQQQSADFVILIDKSRSMRTLWPQVQSAVSSFVDAIPDNDYLSVIAFGDKGEYLGTPTLVNPATRSTIKQSIAALEEPEDGNTDLGKAFERCLNELNRPNGNKLKFVFFLTDFNHDPPSGSPYAQSKDPHHRVWQELVQRRQNELSGKVLEVFALLLPLGGQVGRDISLGEAIFPGIEKVPIRRETLGPWFERRRAEIARDKLKAYVHDDLQRQPTIEKLEVELPLMRTQGHIFALVRPPKVQMVDFGQLHLSKAFVTLGSGSDTDFKIEPSNEQTITFNSEALQRVKIADVYCHENPWVRRGLERQIQVSLEGQLNTEPGKEIVTLNLLASPSFKIEKASTVVIPCGLLPWWAYVIAGLVLLAVVAGVLRYIRPEYLVGELSVIGITKRKILKSEKKKELIVGAVAKGQGVAVPNANWRLAVRAFRPIGRDGKPRGSYARMESGSGKLVTKGKRQTLSGSWIKLPRGSTLEIGETRVSWS